MGKIIKFPGVKEVVEQEDQYVPRTVFIEAVYELLYNIAQDDKDVGFVLNCSMDAFFERKIKELVDNGMDDVEAVFKASKLTKIFVEQRFKPLE